jgi:ABC-2 type transport system permease protein
VNGFLAFLGKELLEIRRTWRIWVLPGILMAVGLSSPILAAISPRLIESLTAGQPDVIIQIPDPTAIDAYLQFAQSLLQIVLLALIIVAAGVVSSERRSGTAILVLTKPVSRSAFLLAKFIAQMLLIVVALIPASFACWLVTLALFDEAPPGVFVQSTLLYVVLAALFIATMMVFSTLVNSQAGAAGLGLVMYLIIGIFSGWGPTQEYSPAGLFSAIGNILTGADPPILGPVLTGILATGLLLTLAILIFTRQEQTGCMGTG